jgi:hypothetical protein
LNSESPNADQLSARDRAWVCRTLGVPGDAAMPRIRAAALMELEKAQFVPAPALEQAVLLAADHRPQELWVRDGGGEMFRPREVELRQTVERLASYFFELPPEKRRAAWQSLRKKCDFSIPLATRLDALAAGLDVTLPAPDTDDDSPGVRLAKKVVQAFIASPSERVAWHEELLRSAAADPRAWQSAARELQERFPLLAPLAPELIASMADAVRLGKIKAKKTKAAKKRQHKDAARSLENAHSFVDYFNRPLFGSTRRMVWPSVSGTSSWRWPILLAIIIFSNALRVAIQTDSPPRPHPQPWPAPTINRPVNINVSTTSDINAGPDDIMKGIEEARRRGVQPPPDASHKGKEVFIGKAFRRLFNIPDNVDLFIEDGRYVFRRRVTTTKADNAERSAAASEKGAAP